MTALPGPTGNLLHKATLSRLGDITNISDKSKQTQRVSQNDEIKEYSPNEKQSKTPEKNEIETSSLSHKKFKILVIKMLNKLRRRIDKLSENFNKEIENIKQSSRSKKIQ